MKHPYRIPLLLACVFVLAACADVPAAGRLAVRTVEASPQMVIDLQPAAASPPAADTAIDIPIEELVFAGEAFDPAEGEGVTLLPDGLGQAGAALQSVYTSAPLAAPIPFNAVVPEWTADLPETTDLHVELRTGPSVDALGEWVEVHPVADWMIPGEEQTVGEMLIVPPEAGRHTAVQYRLTLSRESTAVEPVLRELRLVFLDSTAGPSTAELILRQQELDQSLAPEETLLAEQALANPKPFVISRDVWCLNPSCDYSSGLQYEPVTHLILHHTVSSTGADGDSAAVVRAIWAYHTFTRDWGDIGYNFLVDTKGVLYEGHLGGEDVVGIHAAGANSGSMALAMIGSYSLTNPPEPMLDAVVDVFSWKAEQRNIDVLDASNTLPNIDWGLPNLMGHRDVYGTTECPGDTAHALLPEIRDRVAERIGLESPYLVVDELSSAFRKSSGNWYVPQLQCGHNGHAWYTYSTTSAAASTNWGEWRPVVPESGRYEIQAFAPYCNTGRAETQGAEYAITHMDGVSTVTINQDERIGLWTSLGEYNLRAGSDTVVRLSDLTRTDNGVSVWFDALRLRPLEALPGVTLVTPADGSQLADRDITFTWQIENPDKVKATILQVATDEAFQQRIINDLWAAPVLSATHTLNQDYAQLFWRVTVTSAANNEYPSPTYRFGLDSGPPQSAVDSLYWLPATARYLVRWSGTDAGSGVKGYTIAYRVPGEEWQVWLEDTSTTSGFFAPPDPGAEYEFRSQAEDALGNREPPHETADIATSAAHILDQASLLPVIRAD